MLRKNRIREAKRSKPSGQPLRNVINTNHNIIAIVHRLSNGNKKIIIKDGTGVRRFNAQKVEVYNLVGPSRAKWSRVGARSIGGEEGNIRTVLAFKPDEGPSA